MMVVVVEDREVWRLNLELLLPAYPQGKVGNEGKERE